jgi:hypothetical protein
VRVKPARVELLEELELVVEPELVELPHLLRGLLGCLRPPGAFAAA